MQSKVFGSRRDQLTGEWRRLHKEEGYDLYLSTNNIRVIKSKKLRSAGSRDFSWENLRDNNHLKDLGQDGRMML